MNNFPMNNSHKPEFNNIEKKYFNFLIDGEMINQLFDIHIDNFPFLREEINKIKEEEGIYKKEIISFINQTKSFINETTIDQKHINKQTENNLLNIIGEKEVFNFIKKDSQFNNRFTEAFKNKMKIFEKKNINEVCDEIEKTNLTSLISIFIKYEIFSKNDIEQIVNKYANNGKNLFKLLTSDLKKPKNSIEVFCINYCLSKLYEKYGSEKIQQSKKIEDNETSILQKKLTEQKENQFILTHGRENIMKFFEKEINNHILKSKLPEEINERTRISNNMYKFNLPKTDSHYISLKEYIYNTLLDEIVLRKSIEEIINNGQKDGKIKVYHSDIVGDICYGHDYIAKNNTGGPIKIDLATIDDSTENIYNNTLNKKISNKKRENIDMIICFNTSFKNFIKRNLFLHLAKEQAIPSLEEYVKKYLASNENEGKESILTVYKYDKITSKRQIQKSIKNKPNP